MQNIKDIAAEKKTLTSIQYLKKSIKQMKFDQFQLLFVDGLYRDSKEIEVTYFFWMVIMVNNSFRTSIAKHFSLLNKDQIIFFVYSCGIPEDLMETFAKSFKSFVA